MSVASGWAPGASGAPQQLSAVIAPGAAVPQRFTAVVVRPPTAQDFHLAIQAGSEALQHARDPATRALLLQQATTPTDSALFREFFRIQIVQLAFNDGIFKRCRISTYS